MGASDLYCHPDGKVLTGDRMETAINVSMSAGHFNPHAIRLFACGLSEPNSCRVSPLPPENDALQAALKDHLTFVMRDRVADADKRGRSGARYGAINDTAPLKARPAAGQL